VAKFGAVKTMLAFQSVRYGQEGDIHPASRPESFAASIENHFANASAT